MRIRDLCFVSKSAVSSRGSALSPFPCCISLLCKVLSLCCRKHLALHVRMLESVLSQALGTSCTDLSLCCRKHLALHVRMLESVLSQALGTSCTDFRLCCPKHLALHIRMLESVLSQALGTSCTDFICAVASTWHFRQCMCNCYCLVGMHLPWPTWRTAWTDMQ